MRKHLFTLISAVVFIMLIAPAVDAGEPIYGAPLSRILRVDADGSNLQEVLPPQQALGFSAIDLDATNDQLYWGGFGESVGGAQGFIGSIRRLSVGGGSPEFVVVGEGGVKVDPAAGKIYYTIGSDCDPCTAVYRANLDGTGAQQIVSAVSFTPLGLNSSAGKLYWYTEPDLISANLDGSGQQVLISGIGYPAPAGIDVDEQNQKIYWLTASMGSLNRADADGTNVEQLVSGLNQPQGLTLDVSGNRLWWTSYSDGTIQRAALDGSGVTTITSDLFEPRGIVYRAGAGQGGGRLYLLSDPELISVPANSAWGVFALLLLLGLASFNATRSPVR